MIELKRDPVNPADFLVARDGRIEFALVRAGDGYALSNFNLPGLETPEGLARARRLRDLSLAKLLQVGCEECGIELAAVEAYDDRTMVLREKALRREEA